MDREQALQRLSLISSKLFRANSISAVMFEYLSFALARLKYWIAIQRNGITRVNFLGFAIGHQAARACFHSLWAVRIAGANQKHILETIRVRA